MVRHTGAQGVPRSLKTRSPSSSFGAAEGTVTLELDARARVSSAKSPAQHVTPHATPHRGPEGSTGSRRGGTGGGGDCGPAGPRQACAGTREARARAAGAGSNSAAAPHGGRTGSPWRRVSVLSGTKEDPDPSSGALVFPGFPSAGASARTRVTPGVGGEGAAPHGEGKPGAGRSGLGRGPILARSESRSGEESVCKFRTCCSEASRKVDRGLSEDGLQGGQDSSRGARPGSLCTRGTRQTARPPL